MKQTICVHVQEQSFGKQKKEQDAAAKIDSEIALALAAFEDHAERRVAFERLLACVRSRTTLLRATPGQGSTGWVAPVFLLHRLCNLASRHRHWIQPCETWQPGNKNVRPVFHSLALHVLARYPVPGFMDSIWDLPTGPDGFRQQAWYIRLARGASLRQLNLPIALTRRMEHHVRQAPDHYTVAQALRYGETRGLGGSEPLAREIVGGRLGRSIEHAAFWRTVIWFFVRQSELKLQHINPIVNFIHATKFRCEEVPTEHGTEYRLPRWSHFSMEGRTLKSVLRLASAWHSDLSNRKDVLKLSWRTSGIQGHRFLEKRSGDRDDLDWSIRELLGSDALYAEGREMHHCVYTYARRCKQGETTIWSLRLRVNEHEKSMATIEVDPRRRAVIQVRAKCNLPVGKRSAEIIRAWAAQAGLEWETCA